ncbi:MAG TPA: hypothetical protein VMT75_05660 [Candidatus Saccharimonadales bacterium]|nr:hypothetical protein [Candidatus Saccharimonadales bacterium]
MARSIYSPASLVICALLSSSVAFPQSVPTPTGPLRTGQVFLYSVRLRETTKVKTENVSSFGVPGNAVVDERALLRMEVLSADETNSGTSLRIRTSFKALSSSTRVKTGSTMSPEEGRGRIGDKLFITAAIRSDGSIFDVEGLADLAPEQQRLWRAWALNFALAAVPVRKGSTPGLATLAPEPESSSEFEGLSWTRELKATGEQKCAGYSLGINPEPVKSSTLLGNCTKLTVTEKLLQAAASVDQTPASYKARNLRTSGTARGQGETRVQVSNESGVIVSSDNEAETHMDVLMERTDSPDAIRYKVHTKTRVQVRLITDSLLVETNAKP